MLPLAPRLDQGWLRCREAKLGLPERRQSRGSPGSGGAWPWGGWGWRPPRQGLGRGNGLTYKGIEDERVIDVGLRVLHHDREQGIQGVLQELGDARGRPGLEAQPLAPLPPPRTACPKDRGTGANTRRLSCPKGRARFLSAAGTCSLFQTKHPLGISHPHASLSS